MQGLDPGFFNDLVVIGDTVYITDSYKRKEGCRQHMLQRFYSLEPEGRVLRYNMTSRELSVVVDNLYIPNGIELHYDNRSVRFCLSYAFQIFSLLIFEIRRAIR